jgi:hypothetical protein
LARFFRWPSGLAGLSVALTSRMRKLILVVDSRRPRRDEIVWALDRAGFLGVPAATGQDALDYLEAGGDASVILLEGAPGGRDWTSFRGAQRHDPALASIPVIALSPWQNFGLVGPSSGPGEPVDLPALLLIVRHLCAAAAAHHSRCHTRHRTVAPPVNASDAPRTRGSADS